MKVWQGKQPQENVNDDVSDIATYGQLATSTTTPQISPSPDVKLFLRAKKGLGQAAVHLFGTVL
jgi:hypothetical protein